MSFLRWHFRRREDPYAGADVERAVRLAGVLWVLGAVLVGALLPVAPPTKELGGSVGWAIAGGIILASLLTAVRAFKASARVGVNELFANCVAALVLIGVLEWLAGGRSSPYHQLLMLSVLYTASAHPPRRFGRHFVVYVLAVVAPFVYGPFSGSDVGDAGLQIFITLVFAMLASVQMDGVRMQRIALREQGEADRRAAETDALTGLGNRRALMADLEGQAPEASGDQPLVLSIFDLDGFKAYNDSFGHPAGDALLVRLGRNLTAAVGASASAYRMGGDEFCVLATGPELDADRLIARATAALSERGERFSIGASQGTALMPTDT